MDNIGDYSVSEWDEAKPRGSGQTLWENLIGWGHGRRGNRVVRRVDFSTDSDLFGWSFTELLGGGLRGVGAGGPVPAPGIGGAVQVVPALPQTPRRTSPVGGEGRGAGAAVQDVDMCGMNSWGLFLHLGMKGADAGATVGPY